MATEIVRYGSEGWVPVHLEIDGSLVLEYARVHRMLPVRTEREAIAAAEATYGWGGRGGPWQGQIQVRSWDEAGWLMAWES